MTESNQDSGDSRKAFRTRMHLSAMMFLQYFPQGVWGVTVTTYIAANTGEEGAAIFSSGFAGYSTAAGAIGSLISPILIGHLSDRYFSSERLLSACHVMCALATWGMASCQSEIAFFFWLMLYYQCFVPACTLTNKISLKNLSSVDEDYPFIRLFSSFGWIASGLFVGTLWPALFGQSIEAEATPLLIGSASSIVMALFSLTLPHTPPEVTKKEWTFGEGFISLKNRSLLIFLGLSFLITIPTMAYNNYANLFLNYFNYPQPASLMTLGQVSDLVCLWATPWLIARFGLQRLFFFGGVAWTARYSLLAIGSYFGTELSVYLAILIHGPCYAFIYVIGVMYVDRLTDPVNRGAAQGLHSFACLGIGNLLGSAVVGYSQATYLTPHGVTPPPYDWTSFWILPAAISGLVLLVSFRYINKDKK